jgi:hypothetical protein
MALKAKVIAAVFLAPLVCGAGSFVEPQSEVPFDLARTVAGRPYLLIGAGVRKRPVEKLYAMGLYVEEVGARRAFPALAVKAGGRSREKLLSGDRTQSFVIWGDFGKAGVLHFLRDVKADEVRSLFEEKLAPLLAESVPQDLRDRARAFVALLDRDLKSGDEIVIETNPAGKVELSIAGARKEAATDARLARWIWEAWLGARPVSTELRKALVERIDVLGK